MHILTMVYNDFVSQAILLTKHIVMAICVSTPIDIQINDCIREVILTYINNSQQLTPDGVACLLERTNQSCPFYAMRQAREQLLPFLYGHRE